MDKQSPVSEVAVRRREVKVIEDPTRSSLAIVALCHDGGALRIEPDEHRIDATTNEGTPMIGWLLGMGLSVAQAVEPAACINGNDGGVACGWSCLVGNNGAAACSNVPWGACIRSNNGQAVCLQSSERLYDIEIPVAGCIRGNDGGAACGWGCLVGNNGIAMCSNVPWGSCIRSNNGQTVCLQGSLRHYKADAPAASCVRGNDGGAACGWGCLVGNNGIAACSNVPWGVCSRSNDGRVICL